MGYDAAGSLLKLDLLIRVSLLIKKVAPANSRIGDERYCALSGRLATYAKDLLQSLVAKLIVDQNLLLGVALRLRQ